jgi:hypothetical protein
VPNVVWDLGHGSHLHGRADDNDKIYEGPIDIIHRFVENIGEIFAEESNVRLGGISYIKRNPSDALTFMTPGVGISSSSSSSSIKSS